MTFWHQVWLDCLIQKKKKNHRQTKYGGVWLPTNFEKLDIAQNPVQIPSSTYVGICEISAQYPIKNQKLFGSKWDNEMR